MHRLISRLKPGVRSISAVACTLAGVAALGFGAVNIKGAASQKMTQWVANTHPKDTVENREMGVFLLNEFANIGNRGLYWGNIAGILLFGGFVILLDKTPVTTEEKKRLIKKLQAEVLHEELFTQTYAALKEVQAHDDN